MAYPGAREKMDLSDLFSLCSSESNMIGQWVLGNSMDIGSEDTGSEINGSWSEGIFISVFFPFLLLSY